MQIKTILSAFGMGSPQMQEGHSNERSWMCNSKILPAIAILILSLYER
jgi:hypothetical protein